MHQYLPATDHQWASLLAAQPGASDIGGLGTAATVNTGTSGGTIPLNNGSPTESGTWTFTSIVIMNGLPTSCSGIVGSYKLANVSGTLTVC